MDRRRFLRLLLALPAALAAGASSMLGPGRAFAVGRVPQRTAHIDGQLEKGEFAYVSPLLADGRESSCHAELWYAWIDGSVVVIVSAQRWKAQAIGRGLDKARIWVGDYGRWRGWIWNNESFREGHRLDARGELVQDEALLDKLLAAYERKYPAEIAEWRDRMRAGYRDGTRVLIRYTPIG